MREVFTRTHPTAYEVYESMRRYFPTIDEMPTVIGLDQIREVYAGAFKGMCFHFDSGIDDVTVEGDMAVARAHATGTMTILVTNNTIDAPEHRELFLLRSVDGQWRISAYMFNTSASKRP